LFAENRGGTKIWLEGPFGQMGVAADERDGVCIAGGTGLAPILSIVADRLARTRHARFTIVFGARDAGSLFAMDRLQQLQAAAPKRVTVLPILSHEAIGSAWQGRRGLVTAALDATLGIDFAATAAFVCGSLPMVEAVEARLAMLGVPRERIHADKFLPTGF
jgi:ferredoxin-NADP reductase